MSLLFELQGHRGARGLKPENTLPGFEVAFDLGVSSVELDLHLTADDQVIVFHDACISDRLCTPAPPKPQPIRRMTLAELRRYRVERNPDPARFPAQDASITSRAQRFADQRGIDPYTPPTLAELLEFAAAFSRPVRMDLELKRVPGHPETIGDDFDGTTPGLLELRVVEAVHAAGFIAQTTVRSFDHRSVRAIKALEPRLMTAVLIAGTAPVDPVGMVCAASADLYCPEVHFLDELQVRQCHEAGIRVLPWTVNDPDDWRRLLDWGVDGMTTDYPDRLAEALRQRGIAF